MGVSEVSNEGIERVLVVTAHPDDVDFGAGGTIAGWVTEGIHVSYCICTNGDQGGNDDEVPRSEIPAIRQSEQRAAGKVLGVEEITFLDYVDGWLQPTIELRKSIVRAIRIARPDRMVIQSPERNWERIGASHPDHMAAGEAAIQAIYPDARNPFAFPDLLEKEGLQPWTVREAWIMGSPTTNHFVDTTEFFERKIEALKAHHSQTAHMEDMPGMVRMWGERIANANGLPEGRTAEAFKIAITA